MASSSNDPFIIAAFISGSQQGTLTADEQEKLDAWIAASDENRQLWMELNNPEIQQQNVRAMGRFDETAGLERFLSNKPVKSNVHRMRVLHTWKWAAAVLVLALGVSTYFLLTHRTQNADRFGRKLAQQDIPPGKNGAILTLADGTQLVLDSLGEGKIATQNGTQISLNNNELKYDATAATDGVAHNTITTPKGRQYHVILPDGTEVWLNAASSIQYPVAFKGRERRVKISGEVYLEVAAKSWQPFIIETDQMKLEVLGTSFNVNTYDDEKTIRTTLLTGAVKITPMHAAQPKVLVPGQTAVLSKPDASEEATLTVTETPDPDKIIAWKNGLFNFDGMDLYSVMRQLERWYNIDIQYVGKPENVIFKGKMHRNTNLSDVLKVLETMDVNLELKGNILYVK
ncbi:FecR family protein [Chitinophaga ginsengisegetis]|uniref:FecR family protein n=1 Tax=Chitinophaga ginsengisegetis TaxID=393003 RepID=UPI000DB94777|nr:FecR family protein [Chitinophaga ginsengisegetis]MDR6569153.1 ferric-dicitrate binding protein FerR (iron transport regulator) [Chitinophaga ginsengisegetis]MDR6648817.1 ferric-dicitrate binding protein FerR (iron transport regulator) [Chitinophaga ginsengisegetis]MDR6655235.1 ferric-dicitrate binding protein FerR (iron transport regulator) [Chitinophaga ginsengisegetis]